MRSGEIICPRHRPWADHYKDLTQKGSYSIIFVVLALIALRPVMVNHIVSRAEAYSAFGLHQESKRQCNKALLLDNDNSRAWCQLARIYRTEGNREMAYGAYLKATQADAANKPAQFELGVMYVQDDLYREAIPCFDQVRKLGPDKPGHLQRGGFPYHKASLDTLAMCYEKAGDIAKAEFTLEEIQVFYPGYAKADVRLTALKRRHSK
jgi:tetratricopeptide (TPR) repeat protein